MFKPYLYYVRDIEHVCFPSTKSFCYINLKEIYFTKTYQLCYMLRSNWIHNFVSILPCRCYACYETKYLKRNAVGCKYISKQGQRIKWKNIFHIYFFLVVGYVDFRPFFNTKEFFGIFQDHKLNPNNFRTWYDSAVHYSLYTHDVQYYDVIMCYEKGYNAGIFVPSQTDIATFYIKFFCQKL